MTRDMNIIDPGRIEATALCARPPSRGHLDEILAKAISLAGLRPEEALALFSTDSAEQRSIIFDAARRVKEKIYGKRIVLFAPLYLSNDCENDCLYCGFRRSNNAISRRTLDMQSIEDETRSLLKLGHKRLLIVSSESADAGIDYLTRSIEQVYQTRIGKERIRRVNVNAAPMSVDEFRSLKAACIGTYQIFQESYHPSTYANMHPSGPKSDYHCRISAPDRAMEAGIDDIGIGALLGLHDAKFELAALLEHAAYLENKFGVGPHTISVPRVEPAHDAPTASAPPVPVRDDDFKLIIAVLRLAVPYAGLILSTRESASLRDEAIGLGISQISSCSNTNPGGYTDRSHNCGQFSISDDRNQEDIIQSLLSHGHIPSFCTACYRSGRTGESFMNLAKPGHIAELCHPNCLITFKEYLLDHGGEDERARGEIVIHDELSKIEDIGIRAKTNELLKKLTDGERDLFL